MEDTEYEPTRESYLGTIVRLTEELAAMKQERDAALAEAREMRRLLTHSLDIVGECACFNIIVELRKIEGLDAALCKARAEREEVEHE